MCTFCQKSIQRFDSFTHINSRRLKEMCKVVRGNIRLDFGWQRGKKIKESTKKKKCAKIQKFSTFFNIVSGGCLFILMCPRYSRRVRGKGLGSNKGLRVIECSALRVLKITDAMLDFTRHISVSMGQSRKSFLIVCSLALVDTI